MSNKYLKKGGITYCNFYVQDVMKAAGIPFPQERASATVRTLRKEKDGWHKITIKEAHDLANQGYPVIAGWENPESNKSGHLNIILPTTLKFNSNDPYHSIEVRNAGTENYKRVVLTQTYGKDKLKNVEFFVYKP